MCGMACLKMILAKKLGNKPKLVKLGQMCAEYGGYKVKGDKIDGLHYKPFLKFIKNEFDLDGKIYSPMEIDDIISEADKEHFLIASVSAKIRDPQSTPNSKGGHLVLVVGYSVPEQTLLIHNPSGFQGKSQEYSPLSFTQFEKFFAHRGMSIW